jgi:hypothetical protein
MSKDGTVGNVKNILEICSTCVLGGTNVFFAGICGGVDYGCVQLNAKYSVQQEYVKYFV